MRAALWIVLSASVLRAQPAFEVASVKANTSGERFGSLGALTGGRFNATNVTLEWLLKTAYHVEPFQIAGVPAWGNSERFDIDARAADGKATPDQIRQMVGKLLADRFQVVVHREKREQATYSLLVAKNGPKLNKAKHETCDGALSPCGGFRIYQRSQMWGYTVSVGLFAAELTFMMGRMVVDKTGIAGLYDIRVEWTPEHFGPEPGTEVKPDEANATLFTALQEQLGLRLQSEKAFVETIVVDRANRPSTN
jgi:uncharacterized protein (TIGR03435 family)